MNRLNAAAAVGIPLLAVLVAVGCPRPVTDRQAEANMVCFAGKSGGQELLVCSDSAASCAVSLERAKLHAETLSECKPASVNVTLQE